MSQRTDEVFTPRKAIRTGTKPLIGFYGLSGGGKTFTSLLCARGLVGPDGKIVVVDTESGRGSLFADIPIIGGYDVIDLEPPFTPARYLKAIKTAEEHAACVIVDSMSHLWEGEGGVLDMQETELDRMAGNDWAKREACKMAAWIKPKKEFKDFRNYILRNKAPLICCFRGQQKTHMEKEQGKTKVFTDKFTSPIFDHHFIFELLLNGEVMKVDERPGCINWTKVTHPDVAKLLPRVGEQFTIAHGESIARWCKGERQTTPTQPAKRAADPLAIAKQKMWAMLADIHEGKTDDAAKEAVRRRLVTWNILIPGQNLSDLTTVEQVQEACDKIELSKNPQ